MVSILQVDGIGKRYGILPSEVLKRGDTFDLYILDAALSFERYHAQKELSPGKPVVPNMSTEQLLEIFNRGKQ